MMVVLAILKWIGIVLLSIVGVLLVLLVLLMFVPVRYAAAAEKEEEFRYTFRFSWLYPLVYIQKPLKKKDIFLYVLGIPVKSLSGGSSRKEKRRENGKSAGEKTSSADEKKEEKAIRGDNKEHVSHGNPEMDVTGEDKKQRKRKKKGKKTFSFESVSSIIKVIREKETRHVLGTVKKELGAVFCYLSPRKVKGEVQIGTGDPASTGLMVGGISLMPLAYQNGIHIVPDFERKIFRGNCRIRGRVRVIYFIRLLIRVYRDEELRRVWNRINKKEAA